MKETIKAKMKENLIAIYDEVLPRERDDDTTRFLKSIEGKEVELVFIGEDAFEKEDFNFWLPNELWDRI